MRFRLSWKVILGWKNSEPGHGNMQEIDADHSIIKKRIRHHDIYSPLCLIKIFLAIPQGKCKLKILQIQPTDYFNYDLSAKELHYNTILYTQVKSLTYKLNQYFNIYYKNPSMRNWQFVPRFVNKMYCQRFLLHQN